MRLFGLEIITPFARFSQNTSPPQMQPDDHRFADDVIARPNIQFFNPDALTFPEAMKPVVPGAGGYCPMGLGALEYNSQPQWDRGAIYEAGPVREFFRNVLFDNRVKHL